MSESPEILGEVLRVLVVRPDRLGDVILSTPVFAAIRHRYPNAYISVSVRAEIAPLLRGLSNVDEVLVFDPKGRHRGFSGFVQLIRDFRAGRFDAIVVLQTELKIAAAAFLAGIPLRLGPMSKIHSYLFFNRGVRQRRSQVTKHESEYNLDLLAGLGICTNSGQFKTEVVVSQEVLDKAAMWLAEKVCGPGVLWIAVHPGMGGSALNWPAAHYETLVRSLVHDRGGLSCRVLMTFGPGEGELRGRYQQIFAGNSNVIFYGGADSLGVDFFAGVFRAMQSVGGSGNGPQPHGNSAQKTP
ncbi:glycosyltransferase family 9 protein, partial [Bdellovibrionota bacterium FG-2]